MLDIHGKPVHDEDKDKREHFKEINLEINIRRLQLQLATHNGLED